MEDFGDLFGKTKGTLTQHAKPMAATAPYLNSWGSYQADLMFIDEDPENSNKGIICNIVNNASRFLYSRLVKTKAEGTKFLIETITALGNRVHDLRLDAGVEWSRIPAEIREKTTLVNKSSKKSIRGVSSMALIERVNRTIRLLIEKYITLTKSNKIIDVFDQIIDAYNSHKHSIGWKPKELEALKPSALKIFRSVTESAEKEGLAMNEKIKKMFPVGSRVRIRVRRGRFSKDALPQFSEDVYVVREHRGYNLMVVKEGEETDEGEKADEDLVAKLYTELTRVRGKDPKLLKANTQVTNTHANTQLRKKNQVKKSTRVKNSSDFAAGVDYEVDALDELKRPIFKKSLRPVAAKRAATPNKQYKDFI
jgi:viroplasmin and RNaseH domain-containing protein